MCVCARELFGALLQFDHIYVKFEGQGHRSKFTVTGGNKSSVGMIDRGVAKAANKYEFKNLNK